MQCAHCKHSKCYTEGQNCTKLSEQQIVELYAGEDRRIMDAAASVEARNYMKMCRLEESAEFAKQFGAKTVGVAFCIGLAEEAKLISAYFEKSFKVHSVCCKVCGTGKDKLGLEQVKPGTAEAMCNPKAQAAILADCGTELNFTVGLCVGHDMLFSSASTVPVSCLVVKDRVLSHNPLGAVYSRYWRRKLGINPEEADNRMS
jgi:uncharacterized metal-binding protein